MNKKQDMTTQPESGKNFPLTVKLTVSAVIAQMITFLYNTADSMFVAKIDGSGIAKGSRTHKVYIHPLSASTALKKLESR